jgi:hypothetical protein
MNDKPNGNHTVSQIHKCIRDGDYDWLPDLVKDSSHLISTPNPATGWTALHFAASHFLPIEWYEYLLGKAPICSETYLGETMTDLLLKSYLDPLPWHSTVMKNRSKLLKTSMETVTASQITLIRSELERTRVSLSKPRDHRLSLLLLQQRHLPIAVQRIVGFLSNLRLFARAVLFQDIFHHQPFSLLEFVAGHSLCPKVLLQLLLPFEADQMNPSDVLYAWSNGRHLNIELLEFMVSNYPIATLPPCNRSLLQNALTSGKFLPDVQLLLRVSTIATSDPITGLPSFALSSLVDITKMVHIEARQGPIAWNLVPQCKQVASLNKARLAVELRQLTSVYLSLRASPNELINHGTRCEEAK